MQEKYFNWLVNIVCKDRFANVNSYSKLLSYLHNTPFTWSIPMDQNRAEDGIELRYYFAYEHHIRDYGELEGPCSVFEMVLALAMKMEDIMDDPSYGNRTSQWFWRMLTNLGLSGMSNRLFDITYVEDVVVNFLYRNYESNGEGNIFIVKNPAEDMRDVEIWDQMLWYLNDIAI